MRGRRFTRLLAIGPVGALVAVGLSVVPATTVHAEVVHRTKAGEVSGPVSASDVRQLPFPAAHAALYWAGNPDANVTVAFSADGVTFGAPLPVEEDEVGMQLKNGQTYGAVLPAGGATVARVSSDRPIGRLTILALADDGTTVEKSPGPKNVAGAQTTASSVLPRSAWGADESLRFKGPNPTWPPVFQTIQKLVVHHTAGVNGESGTAAQATIRSIYYYHAITQGWGDIGYNFLIDAAGTVYKGRSTSATATDGDVSGENGSRQGVTAGHAYGYNSGTVGVALLGNFVSALPLPAAEAALKSFLISKASAHGLDTAQQVLYTNPVNGTQATFENVPGHLEVPDNATECPGGMFLERLKMMRSEMQAAITAPDGVAPSDPTAPTAVLSRRTVNVAWKASTGDTGSPGGNASGVAGYDVWRSSAGVPLARIASTTGLTYADNATVKGITYTYVVRSYDGAANRSGGAAAKPVTA